jgi:RNA polymerase primary sigma factor
MKCVRHRNADLAAVSAYLQTIKDETLLTADEEGNLAGAIARGERDARARMIHANLRLVVKIAQSYIGRGMGLEDLIGEGNVGLIRAAEEFQPGYGTRFCIYAVFWIKQSINSALSNSMPMIRLPSYMLGLMNKWRKAEQAMECESRRKPTFHEVASSLGLSEIQKIHLKKAQQARQVQHESASAREKGGWSAGDECDPYGPPDLAVESLDVKYLLLSRLESLDGRERIILTLRFGLENETPMSLQDISSRLGVTREWVRHVELKAFRKLRGELQPIPGNATRRSTRPKLRAAEVARRDAKSPKVTDSKKPAACSVSRKASPALSHPLAAIGEPCVLNGQWPPLQIPKPPEPRDNGFFRGIGKGELPASPAGRHADVVPMGLAEAISGVSKSQRASRPGLSPGWINRVG